MYIASVVFGVAKVNLDVAHVQWDPPTTVDAVPPSGRRCFCLHAREKRMRCDRKWTTGVGGGWRGPHVEARTAL